MIELQFHGAARQVTGSMHVLRCGGTTLSLDCGLFQGRRAEARQLNERLPLRPRELDMVVLSHAHIDHSGRLPLLAKGGFAGPIWATPATADLCGLMLPDSGHIQEEDALFWNTRRADGGDRIEPLYTAQEAKACLPQFRPLAYNRPQELAPGVRATFLDAGHLLGSAMVLLELSGGNGSPLRLLFTGDLGRFNLPILNDPAEPLPECDYLITESTYADRRHDNPLDTKDRLCRIIAETRAAGGKVVIPAFSVGRTQEVIYYLMQAFQQGRLAPIPVFVDSPLSTGATRIFARHPECYDAEAARQVDARGEIFAGDGLVKYITDVADSKALNDRQEPCVILAASGMCESGRILHHLKNNVQDERNTVLVVGFMAQHTLGRRIVERREEIRIFGRMYRLLARVEILNGLSAHADAAEFRRLLGPLAKRLKRAFVVHGEERQSAAMKELLEQAGCRKVDIPSQGDKVRLN